MQEYVYCITINEYNVDRSNAVFVTINYFYAFI